MSNPEFSLIPQFLFRELTHITPDFLAGQGITFLMIDLDNTIAAYSEDSPSESILQWFQVLSGSGIKPFIISNSKRTKRVEAFAKALDTAYLMNAKKPSITALRRALDMAGAKTENTGLIGDQVFTDALAANRAGIVSIIVRPKRFTNPFLALRYLFEIPFRCACKLRFHLKGA